MRRRGNIWMAALVTLLSFGTTLPASAKISRLARARNTMAKRGSKVALRAFESAAAEAPDDGAVWCELGWVASLAGEDERAERALDKGLRLLEARGSSTGLGGCYFERAKLSERRGALVTARNHYHASLLARPNNALTLERRDAIDSWLRLRATDAAPPLLLTTRPQPLDFDASLPISRAVSSTYSRTKGTTLSYLPTNAIDGDKQTAWQVSDGGVGHWIQLHFDGTQPLARLGIVGGYDKVAVDRYGDRWPLNNRVSRIRLQWQGGEANVSLDDRRDMQWVELPNVTSSWLRIWITDVYAGSRWADTAISELVVHRSPPPPVAASPPSPPAPSVPTQPVANTAEAANAGSGAAYSDPSPEAADPNTEKSSTSWAWCLLALGLFGGPLLVRSKWQARRELRVLLRRATAADRAIRAEADALGGAYAHAVSASQLLCEGAPRIVAHLGEIRSALHRTRSMTSASVAEHRARLKRQEQTAMARLIAILERLEATAAQLAAQRAGQTMPGEIDRMLASLRREIDTAVAADEEAQSLLSLDAAPFAVLRDDPS